MNRHRKAATRTWEKVKRNGFKTLKEYGQSKKPAKAYKFCPHCGESLNQ